MAYVEYNPWGLYRFELLLHVWNPLCRVQNRSSGTTCEC